MPWAIGSPEGGHDAVHPDLGTLEDFDHFVARARELGLEVALDFALQCSPDHPWVREAPASGSTTAPTAPSPTRRTRRRSTRTSTPSPSTPTWTAWSTETLRVLRHWMDHGVRIFRVDNPHTKPVVFWERVIGEINRTDPDVIFLAEAFTRPAMMHTLAQIGFQQSYTYFTWRNTKQELTEYLTELSGEAASYMRPNFFANTPDILHAYLQQGGRPAFEVRAVLAATLSPAWGIYSGYELCENTPLREGSEEYLDSEKYQLRPRDWAAAEREGRTIAPLHHPLNAIRRANPALRQLRDLHFHHADQEAVIAYSKRSGSNTVLVVANLDPHHTQEATVSLDMPQLGLDWHESVPVRDELTGETYHWGRANYVRLEPGHSTRARLHGPATVQPADRRVTHKMIVNEPVPDTFEDTPAKDRDPEWFKRAVFYEVLVRSFQDSNGDGVGDLKGLTAKLDYLQWLGVDCLWLPPFFKSPLRDGGYDVSDYTAVLPEFGDLADFVEFVDAAHQRGMRVIIDFVMNHTSDQHPWFQESRKDPDGPYGDYYVWADDDKQYPDARIIFVDTEASNWTYDPVRKQYYWHRFFSHQPDLNYENPAVQEEMISALKFWLDLGIDGFRLDAVPYLYAEEGTNCENLPATHDFLKRVRKEIDAQYPDTVLLAEANQWPEDVVDYFGDYSDAAATNATWRSTSRSCRASSWPYGANPATRSPRSSPRPRRSPPAASGASSCATTTS